jgi:alanine dehydrogenase
MLIGVPAEVKSQEFRVGLVPGSVREYVSKGHKVIVQSGAGRGIRASDKDYVAAGAEIVENASEVFDRAQMIIKVKEPQPQEWKQLKDGQILFTYLHLAPDPAQAKGLMESGVTAFAYETVTDDWGGLPLLAPMSEVAGRLSIQSAAHALTAHEGGRGLLMGGVPGVLPAKVTVIGGGVVGTHAARMALGLGADVTMLDRSLRRIAQLEELFGSRVKTRFSTIEAIEEEVAAADVVIGAVLVPGANAPKLVSRAMLARMKQGAVLVDVAIDQGGCFETSRPTTHAAPTYVVDDVIHYCVANMPGAVPLSSSYALNNATLGFGLQLARDGIGAVSSNKNLMNGLNVHKGRVTHQAVAEALNMNYVPPELAIGSIT